MYTDSHTLYWLIRDHRELLEAARNNRIQGAKNLEENSMRAYSFYGDQYPRYDVENDKVDPRLSAADQRQLARVCRGVRSSIDAAVNRGNRKAPFFSAGQYLRYDLATDRVDPG